MGRSDDSATRSTLLGRLRDLNDQEAWDDFLAQYGPRIYGWCRRHRLQEADAADVAQDVLMRLVKGLRTFAYDPARGSFRGWLKTVTNNVIRDLGARWARPDQGSGAEQVHRLLQALEAGPALDELAHELEAEADREILREAQERVRLRVRPFTWQAFALTAEEQQPARAVAEQLGLTVAEVYVAKSRVIKLLRAEVERLNRDG